VLAPCRLGRGHDARSEGDLPGKSAIEALRLMEHGRHQHLPIVESGRVIGIVSRVDFRDIGLDRRD